MYEKICKRKKCKSTLFHTYLIIFSLVLVLPSLWIPTTPSFILKFAAGHCLQEWLLISVLPSLNWKSQCVSYLSLWYWIYRNLIVYNCKQKQKNEASSFLIFFQLSTTTSNYQIHLSCILRTISFLLYYFESFLQFLFAWD